MARIPARLTRIIAASVWLIVFSLYRLPALAAPPLDELIVKANPGKLASLRPLEIVQGSTLKGNIPKLDAYTIKLPKGTDLQAAIEKLKADPSVAYVGRNHVLRIAEVFPNDPYFSEGYDLLGLGILLTRPQWGLYNDGVNGGYGGTLRADIHAPEAWEITTGSPSIVIAVLDTGLDYYHPDVAGKMWTNPREIPDNGVDDDRNGYIDDWRGWNFCDPENNDPLDDHSQDGLDIHHGTFVSGIAAASSDNGQGIAGVAWDCPVMALKVITATGYGLEADAAQAVVYAADMGAKVINMSLTGEDSPLLKDAIAYAWQKGSLCIVASGNENLSMPTYPASYPHALAVAATNENDQRCTVVDWGAGGSNYGDYLHVSAPGNGILSCSDALEPGAYFESNGTSASAPFVSGVAALIWSVHPDWTNTQVFNQIIRTADDIMTPGYDIYTGFGRVNAFRALTEVPTVVASVAAAKLMPMNSPIVLNNKVLSTASNAIPGRLYIQDSDYKGGLLLSFGGTVKADLLAGDTVNVFGKLGEISGELALVNPSVEKAGSAAAPKPLVMRNIGLGGAGLSSQAGVVDQYSFPRTMAIGLNNIGLVTQTWGKVTAIGFDWFYIDDGAHLDDGSPYLGVYVTCPGLVRPGMNRYVKITGISSCDIPTGSTVRRRVLRPRTQSDIQIVQ